MKIILSGATGTMGKLITEICSAEEGYEIVCGYAKDTGNFSFPVYQDLSDIKEHADVIIDFSNHSALHSVLKLAEQKQLPVVIATTGLNESHMESIRQLANKLPIFQAGNTSLGIYVLMELVKKAGHILADFDIEIIEKHHNKKVDAPSGTAMMLAKAAEEGRNKTLHRVYGRHGSDAKRKPEEIGIHAVRGGTIVGEHSVVFAGLDEIIEIKHNANSKRIFVKGALRAAEFVMTKNKGLYGLKDMFV